MIFAWISGLFFGLVVWEVVDRRPAMAVVDALLTVAFLWIAVTR